ncbi:MAG: hypothetical protein GYA57_11415 [Myxococcales bacterium]|nr:hypothetical protein [Myxococcales bacterium]
MRKVGLLLVAWLWSGTVLPAAVADDASGGASSGRGTRVSAADYAGTWAQLRVQTARAVLPVVGEVKVVTSFVLRLTQSASGRNLRVSVEACAVEQDSGTSLVRTIFPPALVEKMGRFETTASLREVDGELRYFQARRFLVFGARLEDPERDVLPVDASDERVVDADGDGHPGVTVQIRGMLNGDVYLVQRGWFTLRGTAAGGDRIDGRIEWGEDRSMLGSSNPLLPRIPESRPDNDPAASWFRTTRIDPSMTCAQILEQREALFAR